MVHNPKSMRALVLRLVVGLALLGCPREGSAQGTWTVLSLSEKPSEGFSPVAMAVDAAGNLYAAEQYDTDLGVGLDRIQRRDAQGNWSVVATYGTDQGYSPSALAVDGAGNLYVAVYLYSDGLIEKRDAQGYWSVLATVAHGWGCDANCSPRRQVSLAADTAGNLYVAVADGQGADAVGIQRRDPLGNWSILATGGTDLGQVYHPTALAVDGAGNLYVAERRGVSRGVDRIQKRDAQGNWSILAAQGTDAGQVSDSSGLAVDAEGNLYVADLSAGVSLAYGDFFGDEGGRLQKRDAQGNWSVIATNGSALGHVKGSSGLAVDRAGNLYVADTGNNRVQMYTRQP